MRTPSPNLIKGTVLTVDRTKRAPRFVVTLVDRPDVPPLRVLANRFSSEEELKDLVQARISLHRRGEARFYS